MKYLIVAFFGFLCYGCACFDIDNVEKVEELYKIVKKKKYFTILNHTDKTYTNNELFWIETIKINKVWKLIYDSEDYVDSFTYGYSSVVDKDTSFFYHKINTINPEVKINKNEIGNLLKLGGISSPPCHLSGYVELNLFLLSLDGGKRKMFFGDSYGALYQRHWGEITSDCKRHVIKKAFKTHLIVFFFILVVRKRQFGFLLCVVYHYFIFKPSIAYYVRIYVYYSSSYLAKIAFF